MKIRLISSWAAAQELARDWDRLARGVPFRRWAWLGAWARQYAHVHRPFIAAGYAGDSQLVGLTPWYAEDAGASGRVVRQLGTGSACSDYLSLLARPGCEAAFGTALAEWLVAADSLGGMDSKQGRWDLIELASVAPADSCLQAMQRRLAQAGYTIHQRPAANCWRIPLPASWETYVASLSKPNRRRVRACQKRLAQADAVRRVAKSPAELQEGWRVLVDLHQQRRQSLGQAGCFASGEFERFLLSAAEQFLAEDALRLSWIELAGSPAACVIAFRGGDAIYAYQTGISTRHLDENPGWLAHCAAIADAIAEGCTSYDLLRGDEPYKGRLKAEPQPMFDLRIVPRRLAPQLRHKAWLTGLALKSALKLAVAPTGMFSAAVH